MVEDSLAPILDAIEQAAEDLRCICDEHQHGRDTRPALTDARNALKNLNRLIETASASWSRKRVGAVRNRGNPAHGLANRWACVGRDLTAAAQSVPDDTAVPACEIVRIRELLEREAAALDYAPRNRMDFVVR